MYESVWLSDTNVLKYSSTSKQTINCFSFVFSLFPKTDLLNRFIFRFVETTSFFGYLILNFEAASFLFLISLHLIIIPDGPTDILTFSTTGRTLVKTD